MKYILFPIFLFFVSCSSVKNLTEVKTLTIVSNDNSNFELVNDTMLLVNGVKFDSEILFLNEGTTIINVPEYLKLEIKYK